MTLTNCKFEANNASYLGSMIYAEQSVVNLVGCEITNHTGPPAIAGISAILNLTSCTAVYNSAQNGGVIWTSLSSTSLLNSLFANNSASLQGGAVHVSFGIGDNFFRVTNCKFESNIVEGGEFGGAVKD